MKNKSYRELIIYTTFGSRLLQPSQLPREIENNADTNFWGANKVIMGNVEVAYGRIALAVARSIIVFSGFGSFLA